MPIDKEKCLVGMKVQDWYGNVGTVRWIGRMEKAQKPPNKDVGTYAAVEYPPNGKLTRTNGMWEGRKYCEAPDGSIEFVKPRVLDVEMNQAGIAALRAQFGEKIKGLTDGQLIKFLIARKYEIPKVIEMIDNNLKWRSEFMPTHDEYFPPDMALDYPIGYSGGVDREGNLIYFERPGNGGAVHPKDFVKKWTLERIMRWHATAVEMGIHRLKDHPTAKRVTMIIDLTKLGDSDKTVMNFAKGIAKIDQDNYPEHLCKMFIINAPGFFTGMWKLVRLFVDDRTKSKIQVLGKDDWQSVVSQQIDPKYFPSFMGGTDDSWLSNGGRCGGNDPAQERDPATGATALPDTEVSKEEVAAAESAPDQTPTNSGQTPVAGDSAAASPAASP